jgi:hypothetical protein
MRIVAILAGRFHPVHPGHVSSFNQLAKMFGIHNTFMALSEKQDPPRSPFNVGDRAKMALCLGMNKANVISVHYPYSAREYVSKLNLDPDNTVIVFGVSEKDMKENPRFAFEDQGDNSYIRPYPSDGKNLQPVSKNAYVVVTKTVPFASGGKRIKDASTFRKEYARADDESRNTLLSSIYGTYYSTLKPIFDSNIRLTESITGYLWKFSSMLNEATPEQKKRLELMLSEAKKLAAQSSKKLPESIQDYIDET